MDYLDLAVNGALGASGDSDTREPADVASIVCGELSSGADITDACAAAVVSPARYLAWVHDNAQVRESHDRALSIRARLRADTPLASAGALAERRQGRGPSLGVTLGELAKAVATEATLTERATLGRLEATATAPTIVVRFDSLPSFASPAHAPPIPDATMEVVESVTLSDAARLGSGELSADVAADYNAFADDLDDVGG